jgi:CheY-like chemotaxis protein
LVEKLIGHRRAFVINFVTWFQTIFLISKNQMPLTQDWKDRSLLVADDDVSAHALLAAILKPTGIKIYRAYDGSEAFAACIEYPDIQIIMMDIRMPEMNGIEATRLIRKYRPNLPIIAYSALNQPEYKHLMKKMNCNEFLLKPVHPDLILATLSRYLDPQPTVPVPPDIFLS